MLKFRELEENMIADVVPFPLSATICGLLELSAKESEALRAPMALGVNVTLTVQVPVGITAAPEQVSALLAKSAALVPISVTLVIVKFAVPLLARVTACAGLVVPTN